MVHYSKGVSERGDPRKGGGHHSAGGRRFWQVGADQRRATLGHHCPAREQLPLFARRQGQLQPNSARRRGKHRPAKGARQRCARP